MLFREDRRLMKRSAQRQGINVPFRVTHTMFVFAPESRSLVGIAKNWLLVRQQGIVVPNALEIATDLWNQVN
jgi:hypothetical protein